ncbi:type II secretion system protein GspG [Micromonospora avicenniae]|uniref:Type II secretion system (T2SS), protein G n=1 Tax=Micromonospora avicenniae TaxID=1198245 RepID=A0A1N7E6T7_9ACTN|nr:type II secretion system protein GspG [Micromonospora avicenniae]SIR83749.1 Type II secretion system (T2SS), protein G [Micromonospora avicenniae]
MELTNSKRVLLKASYVQTELSDTERSRIGSVGGRAMEKVNFVRDLAPTEQELRALRPALPDDHHLLDLAQTLMAEPAEHLPVAGRLAELDGSAYLRLGHAIARLRSTPAATYMVAAFEQRLRIAPVGRLHLERIEMSPAGTEKGELVFTVPLTPMETVTVSHKEWSTTKDEYEQIISDYFESYSERGVVDKTDASISTENESRHTSAFNFGSSVSGGYGPVTASVTVGLNNSSEDRAAVKESVQNTRETTQKASARTRQEHKVSVKLESTRGAEDTSYRTITNPHADRALRVDYYRMMRKWRVDLYRYGLRLTFDIAVPNPGARLWARHRELADLDVRIRTPFSFALSIDDITETSWTSLGKEYGVALEPPPAEGISIPYAHRFESGKDVDGPIEFTAPPGYTMGSGFAGIIEWWGPAQGDMPVMLWPTEETQMQLQLPAPGTGIAEVKGKGIVGGDKLMVTFMRAPEYTMQFSLVAGAKRQDRTFWDWKQRVWTALRDTALAKHQTQQALLQDKRDRLWMLLSGKDTLTLRRLERDELMRTVLTWLVGPEFETAPNEVGSIIKQSVDRDADSLDTPDDKPQPDRNLTAAQWATMSGFGDLVKFIHHAVEWENLLYFLYPYFWGSDDLAREKLLFEHGDPVHRDFLRAGYARVVVPIRPGFEERFTHLLDTGSPTGQSPYLTIAQEVSAFAHTNYAGIPPANPEQHARPLLYPQQRTTWDIMQRVVEELERYRDANDEYPPQLDDLPGSPFHDAWNRELVYRLPGSGNDYDLISYGADGEPGGDGVDADISAAAGASLMATWFDYTPTSGIDIDVQSIPL